MTYTDKLFIDGTIDAYLIYGLFVEQYGFAELIEMPPFKDVEATEWPEYDGEDVDLSDPVLDTRTFDIDFCITDIRRAEDFFDQMSYGAYHTFYFAELDKTYTLRMVSNGSFSSHVKLGKLTVSFADDTPEVPSTSDYPTASLSITGMRQTGYLIDDVDFSTLGIYVLEGTDDNIRKSADVRENLLVSSDYVAGATYDDEDVCFEAKDVDLELLISAPSIAAFWQRWYTFFAIVMQSEERSFYFPQLEAYYTCYYNGNTVDKFDILRNGHVWCEFTVTMRFTAPHPVAQYLLLATEDGDYVILEDTTQDIFVSILPKQ